MSTTNVDVGPEPVGAIVRRFMSAVAGEELFPLEKYELLFGCPMLDVRQLKLPGTDDESSEIGAIVLNAWTTLLRERQPPTVDYTRESPLPYLVTPEDLEDALAMGTLPEKFCGWVRAVGGKTIFTGALLAGNNLDKIRWTVPRLYAMNMKDLHARQPTAINESSESLIRLFESALEKELLVRSYEPGYDAIFCGGCGTEERGRGEGRQLKLCSRCKGARYCSRTCQKGNFKLHKKICKKPGDEKKA